MGPTSPTDRRTPRSATAIHLPSPSTARSSSLPNGPQKGRQRRRTARSQRNNPKKSRRPSRRRSPQRPPKSGPRRRRASPSPENRMVRRNAGLERSKNSVKKIKTQSAFFRESAHPCFARRGHRHQARSREEARRQRRRPDPPETHAQGTRTGRGHHRQSQTRVQEADRKSVV